MRRAALPLILIPLLTSCSKGPGPSSNVEDVYYLHGVQTIYSIRLDQLPDHHLLEPDTAMRNGLIAGDEELYLTAALFRHHEIFTLDLLVINHTGASVRVQRNDLFLIDADGLMLEPVTDWKGASRVGLRGKRAEGEDLAAIVYEIPDQDLAYAGRLETEQQVTGSSVGSSPKQARRPAPERRRSGSTEDYEAATEIVSAVAADNPLAIEIPSERGAAFWGYFRGRQTKMPLRAVVTLRGQQLVFEFVD